MLKIPDFITSITKKNFYSYYDNLYLNSNDLIYNFHVRKFIQPGVVAHSFNPNTLEAEASGFL